MSDAPAIDQQGFKRILTRNITLPLAAGVVSAGVFIALIVYLLSVIEWVEHTDRVIANGNEISKLAVDMESGMRGFVLTGDEPFLAPYEIEVSGQVLPGWQINGGYTFDDNKTSYGATNGARYNTSMPKHIFRIWTSYRLQENLSRFRVGGGVRAQSSFFKEGTVRSWNPTGGVGGTGAYDGPEVPYAFTDPGRAIWNFFTEYTIDKHWRLALNVNNVFDKRYLQSVGTTAGGNVYGEPRNVMLSLRGQF